MTHQSSLENESRSVSIPYDALMLGAVVQELSEQLCGAQVQDIRHPEPDELHLSIRTRSGTMHLLISIDARFARVHLTNRRAANSPIPTEFCSALRRKIEGGRVNSVVQVGQDRILELRVVSDSGDGKPALHSLIIELMGKHSNIILVDNWGKIVDSARRVSHRINRVRETLPGLKYLRPPGAFDAPLPSLLPLAGAAVLAVGNEVTPKSLSAAIRQTAPFVSPFLAMEIALRCTISDRDQEVFRSRFGDGSFVGEKSKDIHERLYCALDMIFARQEYRSVIAQKCRGAGAYPIPILQIAAHRQQPATSINEAIDKGYSEQLRSVRKEEAGHRLSVEIGREKTRQAQVSAALHRTIDEASRANQLTQSGDLLLVNLWQIKTGDEEILVTDYYDSNGGSRKIRLNPKLTPQENAEALFDRARRSRQGLVTAQARLDKATRSITELNLASSDLQALIDDQGAQAGVITELGKRLIREGVLREAPERETKSSPQFQGHRIRREVTEDGYEILVGDSATANDFLTTRVAASDDLWFHVRSAAGGHVVIRTHGNPETVPDSVLERAAIIAALHSAQKHSSLVAVDYTLKKYVRKPRRAAPGAVVVEREKTLHVSPGEV